MGLAKPSLDYGYGLNEIARRWDIRQETLSFRPWGIHGIVLLTDRYLDARLNAIPLQAKTSQKAVVYIDVYHARDSISLPDIARDRIPRNSS